MKTVVSTLNAKYIHTSLALRYLKATSSDFDVLIKEFTINDPSLEIAGTLYDLNPDVIGFSCYIWNIEETIPVISILKKIHPNVRIILGGPEVTYDSEYWLQRVPEVDIIVRGEGEQTFNKLLSSIQTNQSLHSLNGITYRDERGEIQSNPNAPKFPLNEIPSPFRFEEDLPDLSKRVTYVETSRGCPFTCQFCLSSIEFGVRYFDIDRMKDELTYLMDHGAKTIKFLDRTFNINRKYAFEMFDFLIKHHRPGVVFQFEITADIMRPEVLEFINENAPEGLFRFEIGVQSTNDHTNELIKRKQNFNKLTRTITMVKDGGKVVQHLDLIAGLPEEDYQSFRQTFNDVFAMRPEELQLGFLKMLRGTGLRNNAHQWGYTYMDYAPYEMLSNNALSFLDVIKIKRVEDILEKYWNKHFMDYTVNYIVEHIFETPFDFFQLFGEYWHQQKWNKIGHQLTDLFSRLYQFIEKHALHHADIVEGLMDMDYYLNFRQKPRNSWKQRGIEHQEKQEIYEHVWKYYDFSEQGYTRKELHKHTMIDLLSFDIDEYLQNGLVKETPSLLIAIYSPEGKKVEIKKGSIPYPLKKLPNGRQASIQYWSFHHIV
ncbi:B12-binding domain-containing radical SAM protein [Pontibacillus yanchengensis]|uniref:Fe-S oxidoreductase n=1 Tax=Pontibacillus yanchengensis Y32 TaxID=1385514 RepID=A0A0A2TDQ8_9BACI|nr:B12-binding domain-containing radical SAM protein [Pontibacillus yanchengensis]KGP72216.1 Fe-S oxidoreductase [Pontibacillus yanchengensis Y32]